MRREKIGVREEGGVEGIEENGKKENRVGKKGREEEEIKKMEERR